MRVKEKRYEQERTNKSRNPLCDCFHPWLHCFRNIDMDIFENQEFMSFVIVPALLGIILFIFWILGVNPIDK